MTRLTLLFALAMLLLVPAAYAQSMEGGGYVVYVTQSANRTPMPDDGMMVSFHNAGVIVADDTSTPFHLATHDCTGTSLFGAGGALQASGSTCMARDADGDAWWLSFTDHGDHNEWRITNGTGKYAGMEGGGTTEVVGAAPGGRVTIRWTGRWTMPQASR